MGYIINILINIYLGPPNIIAYNIGKNFISKEFKKYAIIFRIAIRSIPIKAHNSGGMVERYYSPLYRIYHIITIKLLDINKDIALQIAFKVINNFISPDSLIPTLLVFKAYLCIVESNTPNHIVI